MVRDALRVLAVVLALLAPAAAGSFAADQAPPAGALGLRTEPAETGGGGAGERVRRWADQFLRFDFFSDGSPTTTRPPSCGATDCGPGTQCCCCGERCYCKKECSLEPCGGG